MTILEEFKKNYPNAPLLSDYVPEHVCPTDLGYKKPEICDEIITVEQCEQCWNREIEDVPQ